MTDKELIQQCITEYGKSVYNFCVHLACSKAEAEDLYQDTFLLLMEKKDDLDMDKNPKSYLFSFALNLWRNKRRKQRVRNILTGYRFSLDDTDEEGNSLADTVADLAKGPEEIAVQRDVYARVRSAVAKLPDKYREVVLLYYGAGFGQAEIACMLRIPEGTVKSRLSYAKGRLRKMLSEMEVHHER